jgi:hypothetical protein
MLFTRGSCFQDLRLRGCSDTVLLLGGLVLGCVQLVLGYFSCNHVAVMRGDFATTNGPVPRAFM